MNDPSLELELVVAVPGVHGEDEYFETQDEFIEYLDEKLSLEFLEETNYFAGFDQSDEVS